MGQRGKKSFNELATLKLATISAYKRPEPPSDMPSDQAEVWTRIVKATPIDWFPVETHGLLSAYCRHTVCANVIYSLIQKMHDDRNGDDWLDFYERLLKSHERETRTLASLATRMRISQQSKFSHRKGTDPKGPKPWEANKND
jgi:hypothetical protein